MQSVPSSMRSALTRAPLSARIVRKARLRTPRNPGTCPAPSTTALITQGEGTTPPAAAAPHR